MKLTKCWVIALVAALLVAAPASAIFIGNWSGSQRSWNHVEFTDIKAAMEGAGHTVLANSAITVGDLAGVNMYIVGEAAVEPTVGELSVLKDWVEAGNCLLVFTNSFASGVAHGNTLLAGIGSSMEFEPDFTATGPFSGGLFASEGPPFDLVGLDLGVSLGNKVDGGNPLYGFGIQYELLGDGVVFAFGDRYEHNFFLNPGSSGFNVNNARLFLNIAHHHIPEPATLVLASISAGLLAVRPRRRGQRTREAGAHSGFT